MLYFICNLLKIFKYELKPIYLKSRNFNYTYINLKTKKGFKVRVRKGFKREIKTVNDVKL